MIPKHDLLPDDLKELAFRSGLEVRHASFQGDMGKLVRELRAVLTPASLTPPVTNDLRAELIAAVLGTITGSVAFFFLAVLASETPLVNALGFNFLQKQYLAIATAPLVVLFLNIYLQRSKSTLRSCNGYAAYSFISSLSLPLSMLTLWSMNIYGDETFVWTTMLMAIFFSALLFAFRRRYL